MSYISTHYSQTSLSLSRHGDMLYLQERGGGLGSEDMDTGPNQSDAGNSQIVEEDEVDKILSKADGRIERKKDPQL